jgi:hypothetical protein
MLLHSRKCCTCRPAFAMQIANDRVSSQVGDNDDRSLYKQFKQASNKVDNLSLDRVFRCYRWRGNTSKAQGAATRIVAKASVPSKSGMRVARIIECRVERQTGKFVSHIDITSHECYHAFIAPGLHGFSELNDGSDLWMMPLREDASNAKPRTKW